MAQVPAPSSEDAHILASLCCDETIEDIVPLSEVNTVNSAASALLDFRGPQSFEGKSQSRKKYQRISERSEEEQLDIWIRLLVMDHLSWGRSDKSYTIHTSKNYYLIRISAKEITVLRRGDERPYRYHIED